MQGARKNGATHGRIDLAVALAVAALYLAVSLLSEKIAHCDGFGDDGCHYGHWALDFPRHAINEKLGSYYVQRSFPSLVAWAGLRSLGLSLDAAHVIRAFQAMNAACVLVATFTWMKIARILCIRSATTLLGTLGLFCNYGVIKFTTWYPVLGDLWGYAIGFVCLWAYLTRRFWVLVPAFLVAAFTWPSATAPALVLMFFWNARPASAPAPTAFAAPAPFHAGIVVATGTAALWAVFTTFLVQRGYWPAGVVPLPAIPELTYPSIAVGAGFLFFALRRLVNDRRLYEPLAYLRAAASLPALVAVALLIAVRWAVGQWSVPETAGFSLWIKTTAILSATRPAIFVVGQVVYFGPILLVFALRWREVCALLHRQGIGLVGCAVLAVVFGLDSEARHSFTFLALLMPFGLKVLDNLDLHRRTLGVLAALSLVFSKLWLTLPSVVRPPPSDFPQQLAFMSQGPWMANWTYALQGLVIGVVALWLRRAMRLSA